jgi:solute carrier family 30 (zinc transporter), member 2
MAMVLHGSSCHHHNHSHHGHGHGRSSGDDEMKVLQIDDNDKTIQSEAENINIEAALLHVLGDFLQSIGVILAAVIIKIYVSQRLEISDLFSIDFMIFLF